MTKTEANEITVRGILLAITNDGNLYRSRVLPILANLGRRVEKGTYDHQKALKLWRYYADDACRFYVQKYCSPGIKWHQLATTADRAELAKQLQDHYREHLYPLA